MRTNPFAPVTVIYWERGRLVPEIKEYGGVTPPLPASEQENNCNPRDGGVIDLNLARATSGAPNSVGRALRAQLRRLSCLPDGLLTRSYHENVHSGLS